MTLHPTELRTRLRTAIEAAGLDATELARRLGRSNEYIRDFLNGRKDSIKANELVQIEVELQTDPGHLTGFGVILPPEATRPILKGYKGKPPESKSAQTTQSFTEKLKVAYGEKMPIFSAEDKNGAMVIDVAPVEYVMRPWFIQEVQESFAVIIPVYDYDPAFQINDLAIINPRTPLMRNRNTLISCPIGQGFHCAMIVELIRWTKDTWTVRRLADAREEELERESWPSAFRVVARIER